MPRKHVFERCYRRSEGLWHCVWNSTSLTEFYAVTKVKKCLGCRNCFGSGSGWSARNGEVPPPHRWEGVLELPDERLLLTVHQSTTADGSNLNIEFDVGYELGETIFDLEDVYIRTGTGGKIQWSTAADSGFADAHTQDLSSFTSINNLVGTSNISEMKNVTIAGGYSDLVSTVSFGSNTSISAGGDLIVDVDATRNHSILSNAAAYGDGTLATAINVGVHESTLSALLDGIVTVGGNLKTRTQGVTAISMHHDYWTMGMRPMHQSSTRLMCIRITATKTAIWWSTTGMAVPISVW